MEDMGAKIKRLRTDMGMTLEALGEKVGVGKSTVRKWENGMIENMKRDKIAKVANALNVSPSYLMGWDEDPTIVKRDKLLDEIDDFLNIHKYNLICESYDDDYFRITNSSGQTIAGLYDYELLPRYEILKSKGKLTIDSLISPKNDFLPLDDIEMNHIKKYRTLDQSGKDTVDVVLDTQYARCKAYEGNVISIDRGMMVAENTIEYGLNAAHERTDIEVTNKMRKHDDDIMDDDDF
ncbi:MAG: helix-turn-helix transcriptional regulator [Anaerovoracaceae bacterium]